MSVEEIELSDLLAQTLEAKGCLAQIRAQLRANVFLALDEDSKINQQKPLMNKKIQSFMQMPEGQVMFCVVKEFLEFFNLDFTIAVYEPESYMGTLYNYKERQKIIEELGLKGLSDDNPILLHLVKIAQTKSKTLEINLNINGNKTDEDFNKVDDTKTNGDNSPSTSISLNASTLSKLENIETILSTHSLESLNNKDKDDSVNGSSPIPEESIALISFDSNIISTKSSEYELPKVTLLDQSINDRFKNNINKSPITNNKDVDDDLNNTLLNTTFDVDKSQHGNDISTGTENNSLSHNSNMNQDYNHCTELLKTKVKNNDIDNFK